MESSSVSPLRRHSARFAIFEDLRVGLLLLATIFGALSIYLAYHTPLKPAAGQEFGTFSSSWWYYPIESSATSGITVVTGHGDINDVFYDGRILWAVGTDDLVWKSLDRGRTWSALPDVTAPSPKQFIVFFGSRAANLTDEARKVLDEVAQAASRSGVTAITVTPTLDPSDGVAVSRDRARTVTTILRQRLPNISVAATEPREDALETAPADRVLEPRFRRVMIDLDSVQEPSRDFVAICGLKPDQSLEIVASDDQSSHRYAIAPNGVRARLSASGLVSCARSLAQSDSPAGALFDREGDYGQRWAGGRDGALYYRWEGEWLPQIQSIPSKPRFDRVFPSPLSMTFFCLALFMLGAAALVKSEKVPNQSDAINEGYATDRPWQIGDRDVLGHTRIAEALSDFLTNKRTEPPLSIAITGKWGTGKSSLLNLFASAPGSHNRFRFAWFNAWHHQSEENTLGALLDAITQSAIPRWYTFLGFRFRATLLYDRIAAEPMRYALLIGSLCAGLSFVMMNNQAIADALHAVAATILQSSDSAAKATGGPAWLVNLVAISSLAGAFLAAFRTGLEQYGFKPVGLFPRLVRTNRRLALMESAGFRHRFAPEFAAIARALRPLRLVIIIDDLDRCSAEKTVELLQIVYFLMTAGECVVLMAADMDWVKLCVRKQYEEMVALAEKETVGEQEAGKEFPARFLQKLINVQIPVPPLLDRAQALAVVVSEPPPSRVHAPSRWNASAILSRVSTEFVLRLRIALRFSMPILVCSTLIAIAFVVPEVPPADGLLAQPAELPPAPSGRSMGDTDSLPKLQLLEANGRGRISDVWLLVPVTALLLFGWAAAEFWEIRAATSVDDSKEFRSALEECVPMLLCRAGTARELKRLTNQIRFLAMWRRLDQASPPINEAKLVRLASLYACAPAWLIGLSLPADQGMVDIRFLPDFPNHLQAFFSSNARSEHWSFNQTQLDKFKGWSHGVEL